MHKGQQCIHKKGTLEYTLVYRVSVYTTNITQGQKSVYTAWHANAMKCTQIKIYNPNQSYTQSCAMSQKSTPQAK